MFTSDGLFGHLLGRLTAALVAVMWVVTSLVMPPAARAADEPPQGQLTVAKSVDRDTVDPGQPVLYTIELGCSAIQTSCISPVLTDVLPPEFVVTTNSLPTDVPGVVDYEFTPPNPGPGGGTLSARFISPLPSPPAPAGSVGMLGGTTQQIKIPVQFPQDSAVPEGTTVTNTAVFIAENAPTVESSVPVEVNNPPTLLPVGDKNWVDGSAIAGTAEPSTIELKVRNNSKLATVTALSITDLDPDTFEHFNVRQLGPVRSWPAGADRIRILYCAAGTTTGQMADTCTEGQLLDGGTYLRSTGNGPFVPAGLDLSTVTGVRFTFLSPDGSALANQQATLSQVDLGLELRDTIRSSGQAINKVGTRIDVVNTATPSLVATQGTKVGDPVTDSYTIQPPELKSVTTKAYCAAASGFACPTPEQQAFAGQGSRVLVDVRAKDDSGFNVSGMAITEPSRGDPNAQATFDTIDVSAVRVELPEGAASATVTATCQDSSTNTVTWSGADIPAPALCPGSLPASVSVAFSGANGGSTIVKGSNGRLLISGTLNAKATAKTWTNCASSALSNPTNGVGSGASTACDDLVVSSSVLKPTTTKKFFSDTNGDFTADGAAYAGQNSGVGMTIGGTNTSGFPIDELVITEPNPGNPTSVANFAKVDVTRVRVTPPPGTTGAELAVVCRGNSSPVTRSLATAGTQVIDLTTPAVCPPGGFPSSVSVTYTGDIPNSATGTLDLVGTLNAGATAGNLRNCASTTLTSAGSPGAVTKEDCATLPIQPGELTSSTTKRFCGGTDPSCPTNAPPVVAGQNSPLAMRVTGTNTSPFAADTLTIVEPEPDNTVAKAAFDAVDATDVRVRIPVGTTTTTVSATCRSGNPTPRTITGQPGTEQLVAALCDGGGLPGSITVTFTGILAPQAAGGLDIRGIANSNAEAGNALDNCAATTVTRPGSQDGSSQGCATLTPIPNVVTGDAVKTFQPDSNLDFTPDGQIIAGQGGGAVMKISVTNTSGFAIQDVTITEPAPGNTAFSLVDAVRIRVTPPATTTTTTLTLTCDGTTVTQTLGGAPTTVEVSSLCTAPPTGVTVTYSGTIANTSTGTLEIAGSLDPSTPGTSLRNCAVVNLGNGANVTQTTCGTLPILPNVLTVSGKKTFCVDGDVSFGCDVPAGTAIAGQSTRVLLTVEGTNTTRFPVNSLSITDPEPGNPGAVAAFAAVDVTTVRITPPAGTTKQTVAITCRGGVPPADTVFTDANSHDLANPCAGSFPATVSVRFEGTIATGRTGTLQMVGRLNDTATDGDLKNCAESAVTGMGAIPVTVLPCATLQVDAPRIEIDERTKTASAGVIVPGQPLAYSLSFRNAGNIPLTGAVVDDPVDPGTSTEPFRFVRLVSVTTPATPASTVQVYDPDVLDYVPYDPGNGALLDRAQGIRVTVTGTMQPGDTFAFGYQVLLRDEWAPDPGNPNDLSFDNCAEVGVGTATFEKFCSGEVTITPGTVAAAVNKTFNPASLPRPFPGDTTPTATTDLQVYVKNTGDLNLSKIVVTDTDPDFWAAYQVADANAVRVNLPPGADRVQLDVCTSAAACATATFTPGTLTAATNPVPLPAGITADQVWGIRVTFTRADGRYLLTPVPLTAQPPTGNTCVGNSLCMRVRPLATQRPAGSLAPASVENTIQTGVRSIRQDQADPSALFPLPDTSATVSLTQQTASMDIDKDPNTRLSPGSIAPFTLVIENTGRAIIPNLLVADVIPAELEFYQPAGVAPFTLSYQLPDGTPPAAVGEPAFTAKTESVGAIARVSEVSWTWPTWGFVPGAKVTITFQVKLAAGVPADTVVRNTATVTSRPDFPFTCTPDNPDDGQTIAEGQKYCTSWAEITALAGNSFDGTKWVAGDDALGFRNTFTNVTEATATTTCPRLVVDGRAYTHFPCVALNNPGQPFTYLLRLTNSGNTADVSQIQLLDSLPIKGDKGVLLNTQQRGTGWEPRPRLLGGPAGQNAGIVTTTYTTFDTVAQSICFDTWGPNSPAPLPSGCTPATWSPGFTPAATAFRSVLDFGRTDPLSPGESALVRFDVDSPLALTDPASYAWNSYAFQVGFFPRNAPTDAQIRYLTPTEPIQAGIGILYGALEVTKTVVNPPPGVDLGRFPIDYECTTTRVTPEGPQDVVVTGGTLQIAAGQTERVPGALPAGASCRVWETDSKGAQSPQLGEANAVTVVIIPGTAANGTARPPQIVTITNTYLQGYLQLTKALTGLGVQFVDDTTPFVFDITCTFREQPLTNYNPRSLTLTPANPDSAVLGPLPVGSMCAVAEKAPYGGADGPPALSPPPGQDGYRITESGAAAPLSVTATNTFSVGPLVLTKTVANEGVNPALIPDSVFPLVFPFQVTCEQRLVDGTFLALPDYPRAAELSFGLGEVPGIGGDPTTKSVTVDEQLPVGARCWALELDSAGATKVEVVPETSGSAVVVQPPAEPGGEVAAITIRATNTYQPGAIFIRKVVTGEGAQFAKEPFVFDVVCRDAEGEEAVRPFTLTIQPPKRSAGQGELPAGALCDVTERAPYGGADGPAVLTPEGPYTIPADKEFPVIATATNTFSSGSLTVAKELDGAGQEVAEGLAFTLRATCTRQLPNGPIVTVLDKSLQLKGGEQSDPLGPLPIGSVCTVTETDDGGATSTTIAPSPVTITLAKQDVTVTATNTYELGQFTLRKVVTGPGAQYADRPFTFAVSCTFLGQPITIPDSTATIKPPKAVATVTGIPVGADCAVKELAPYGGADGPAVMQPESVTIPRDAALEGDGPQVAEIIATNTFSVGSLSVSKVVDGPAAAEVAATRVFDLKVTCTREGPNGPVQFLTETASLKGGELASYGGLPIGAVCQVTEPNVQGATTTVITPKSVEVTLKESKVSIEVTNTYGVGALRLSKAITGPGAQFATQPFTFEIRCSFQGAALTPRTATITPPATSATVTVLPTGASCAVVETRTGGADAPALVAPATVTIGNATTVEVSAVNTFSVARIDVAKVVVGEGDGPYTLRVACTWTVSGRAVPVLLAGGGVLTLDDGEELGFDVPAPSSCTVTETDVSADAEVTIRETGEVGTGSTTDGIVGLGAIGDRALVEVTNTFPPLGPSTDGEKAKTPDQPGRIASTGASLGYLPVGLLALLLGGLLVRGSRRREG